MPEAQTTNVPEPRKASTPRAGAGREAVRVSLASILTYLIVRAGVPEEIRGEVYVLGLIGISVGLAYAGKKLRDLGLNLGKVVGIGWALLMLGGASPASALTYIWDPASGPVVEYEVDEGGILYTASTEQWVTNTFFRLRVRAVGWDGSAGPWSPWSSDGDFDESGAVGLLDYVSFPGCFEADLPSAECLDAFDFDDDGGVGIRDWAWFTQFFGERTRARRKRKKDRSRGALPDQGRVARAKRRRRGINGKRERDGLDGRGLSREERVALVRHRGPGWRSV